MTDPETEYHESTEEDDAPREREKMPARLPDTVSRGQLPARTRSDYLPVPVMDDAGAVVKRKELVDELIRANMVQGVDYGKIPGTNKDTLYKGGAEQLAGWFGYSIRFPDDRKRVHEDWEGGVFAYHYVCEVVDRGTGDVVAECEGSCNSRESKYGYRWAFESEVKEMELDPTKLEKKTRKSKKPPHREYDVYKVRNAEPYDLVNTLQKMAQKRAMVGAILIATAQSGRFTQDVEDMPASLRGVAESTPEPKAEPPASFFDMVRLWVMSEDCKATPAQWKFLRDQLGSGLTAAQVKALEANMREVLKVESGYQPDLRSFLGS